jgi:hypothetical protein
MTPQQFYDDIFFPIVVYPFLGALVLFFIVKKVEEYKTRRIIEMNDEVDHDEWKTKEDMVPVVIPIKRARSRKE